MVFENIKDRYAVRRPERSFEYQSGQNENREIHRGIERSEYNPPEEKKESRFSRALKTTPRDIRGQVTQRKETWSAGRAGKREISKYEKNKQEEQKEISRRSKKYAEEAKAIKESARQRVENRYSKKIWREKTEAREAERDIKKAKFVAQHPHLEKAGKRAEKAGGRLSKFAVEGVKQVETAYGTVAGKNYITGQQLAMRQQSIRPTTGGKRKGGKEVTRTLSSETVGVSGLSAGILQESYGLKGAEQPRDLLGGLGGGLRQEVNYFGSQKKNGNGSIGIGVKKIDYYGGGKLLINGKNGKNKKTRYY